MSAKRRAYCFTINNYTDKLFDAITHNLSSESEYFIVGKEVGEQGTPHLQGYTYFKNARTLNSVNKMLCKKAHIEPARGNAQQNFEYCSKSGNYFEEGTMPKQGRRIDLEEISNMIKGGKPINEICEEKTETFIRYYRGIERAIELHQKDRNPNEEPTVYWFYGKSGIGKTSGAIKLSPDSYYIKKNNKWWNGYNQQRLIIIDEFVKSKWDFEDLLQVLDRYPYSGETKGGYVKINSPLIVLTSILPPERIFNQIEYKQIHRRVKNICDMEQWHRGEGNSIPHL